MAVSDKKHRGAKFLSEGFVLSQLDGEGMRRIEKQQEIASKQAFKESLLKQTAVNTGSNLSDLRNDAHQELRTERINQAPNPTTFFIIYYEVTMIWNQCIAYHQALKQRLEMICQHEQYHAPRMPIRVQQ